MKHQPTVTLSALLVAFVLPLSAAATVVTHVTASPDIHVDLAPPLVADHEVVVQEVATSAALLDLGVFPEAVAVTAYHRENSLSHLFALDLPTDLGGGLLAEPRDVVRLDTSGPSPVYSLAFDGSAHSVPAGAKVDAVTKNGALVAVSFDVHVLDFGPEDLVVEGTTTFSVLFDGSAAGVPAGMDLDAAYQLESTERLFLSFDTAGELGGFVIQDDDVIEWDLIAGSWVGVVWQGSSEDADWVPAELEALAVVPLDTLDPRNPSLLTSPGHTPSVWSSDPTIGFQWQGAVDDSTGSGLDGYSLLVDQLPTADPDLLVDQGHSLIDPQRFTTPSLADGTSHYFHLRTCDQAGNCDTSMHRGPYWIDTVIPNPVSNLHSTSHTVGMPSSDDSLEMAWTPATDGASGLAGYGARFRQTASPTCSRVIDIGSGAIAHAGPPLADGDWWYHICAVDTAGNWGPAIVAGPYVVDTTPPTVTRTHSVADTGDAYLLDGEATAKPLSQLALFFSEAVENPAGNSTPGDVTNPNSYRVIDSGPDGVLQTASCAGAVGDDLELTVSFVSFGDPTDTASLLMQEELFSTGAYRLIGCAPGGVHDAAGHDLDGDGDGTGGDPFLLDFAVTADHLTAAPTLDDEIAEWIVEGAGVSWDSTDAGPWPHSGSAWVFSSADPIQGIGQCVPVDESTRYRLRARVLIVDGTVTEPTVWAEAELFGSTDCSTGSLGPVTSAPIVGYDPFVQWLTVTRWVQAPAGAQSALVRYLVDDGGAGSIGVFLDDLQLRDPGVIFADDVESGDLTEWSGLSP